MEDKVRMLLIKLITLIRSLRGVKLITLIRSLRGVVFKLITLIGSLEVLWSNLSERCENGDIVAANQQDRW